MTGGTAAPARPAGGDGALAFGDGFKAQLDAAARDYVVEPRLGKWMMVVGRRAGGGRGREEGAAAPPSPRRAHAALCFPQSTPLWPA